MPNTSNDKILIATNNAGKVLELSKLLASSGFIVTTPNQENIQMDVEETGQTFEDNAAIKALAFAKTSGLLSIADDSGLEVEYLHGDPGVRSARYAGENASDIDRVWYLLDKLKDVEWSKRQARFKSVIAIADPEGVIEMFEGTCEGYILFEPVGLNGFGYDPIFYLPLEGKSMSELSLENKNKISHRGLAMEKAVRFLNQIN